MFLPLREFTKHPHFKRGAESGKNGDGTTPISMWLRISTAAMTLLQLIRAVVARLSQLAEAARSDLGDRGRPGTGQRQPGKIGNPKPLRMRSSELIRYRVRDAEITISTHARLGDKLALSLQHRVLKVSPAISLANGVQSIKLAGLGFAGGGVPGGGGGGLGLGGPSSIPPGTCDVSCQFAF